MKKMFKLCSFLLISLSCLAQSYNPLLVVVLMVKNESSAMKETLKPFIEAGIDSFLIFDTGSTDDTIAVAQAYFKEKHILHGIIEQEPFIDFATSRNHALESAQKAFPSAHFMIMPDAEWCIQNPRKLLEFCDQHKNDPTPSYLIRILLGTNCDFYTSRLIRCNKNVQFVGAVHEVLMPVSLEKAPHECYFQMNATRYGIEKSRKRWKRDCELLLNEHKKNPEDIRTIFYLAQTYACLGDHENAKIWYEKRCSMQGWPEEDFISHYRLAQTYESLNNWQNALEEYLIAYALRPHRAEPLVHLAQHYWETDQKPVSFLFAQRACELSYPENDILFVEKELYDFTRYELLGRVAWYVNQYEMGEQAMKKALAVNPHLEHLHKNLEFYLKRKQEN